MVASDATEAILDAAIERVRESRRIAAELDLATLGAFLVDVETGLAARFPGRTADQRRAGEPSLGASHAEVRRPAPLVAITQPVRVKALDMARRFLLSDLIFREAWETHREGMFGADLVASRFPAGLILEILANHDLDVGAAVDDFLDFTVANGFRYYDHPASEIDSDTIGVFLRLQAWARNPGAWSAPLGTVLGCLEREVVQRGHVPVWIHDCNSSSPERPPTLDLGEGCGTVAAHLLLGLLAHATIASEATTGQAVTIERGSLHLLGRITDVGLAANVNYPQAFALAAIHRLIARLAVAAAGRSPDPTGSQRSAVRPSQHSHALPGAIDAARRVLATELERLCARRVLTAQDAALLTLACLDAGQPERVQPAWAIAILKSQQFDGSWPGEPFAAAPNRGRAVTWYSSTTLTTAFCFDALVRGQAAAVQ
jgi:hypothetical protein